jgi:methionyl aminopeptidase
VLGRDRIQYKTREQVLLMRRAGLLVADALDAVRARARARRHDAELDAIAADVIRSARRHADFLGYGHPPYPATLCISVNEEVVHGIPGGRVIAAGDVVSVDGGAVVAGWHGDSAFTAIVPAARRRRRTTALVAVTEEALWRGIGAMVAGDRLNAIGAAVEDHVGDAYGLVEDYGGHGIGTEMHQDPHVLNYRTREHGPRMRPGLCLAIEPMLTLGDPADPRAGRRVDGGHRRRLPGGALGALGGAAGRRRLGADGAGRRRGEAGRAEHPGHAPLGD